MSNKNNLPGVNIKVNDGQMIMPETNTANNMLIIGEVHSKVTESGVVVPEDVVLVQDEGTLEDNFGSFFYGGEINPIAAEWKVARENGVSNLYLLAVKGSTEKEKFANLHKVITQELPDYQIEHIVVQGLYADRDVEGLTSEDFTDVSIETAVGVKPYSVLKGTEAAVELNASGQETLTATGAIGDISITLDERRYSVNSLIKTLNEELQKSISVLGGQGEIIITKDDADIVSIKATDEMVFEGEEILGALKIDSVSPTPETINYGNYADLLGAYAEQQTLEVGTVIVYIGVQPPASVAKKDIKEHVDNLVLLKNEFSKHVQVVAGPQVGERIPGNLNMQWLSGVTHYAVLVNSLAVQHAPTNQILLDVRTLKYDLSLRQMNQLVGNKYVTFRFKNNRIIVIDGVTTAPDIYIGTDKINSDFQRLTTLRSTSFIVGAIREVVDPFIGRPNEFPAYNAMNTAIKGVINDAVEKGVIQDAAYSITLGENLDAAKVDLTILPQFELRKIDVTIGLSLPGGFEPMSQ